MKKFWILVLVISVIFCASCKKKTQENLVGTWEMISFDTNLPLFTTFTFDAGDKLQWTKKDINDSVVSGTANYALDVKLTKKYIRISNFVIPGESPDGKWQIDKVDEKILRITRVEKPDGTPPYWRFEFTKKQ